MDDKAKRFVGIDHRGSSKAPVSLKERWECRFYEDGGSMNDGAPREALEECRTLAKKVFGEGFGA